MTDSEQTLVLVDGSSYVYRAFHAMPDLRAVPGDPSSPATGAIRGMINMMQALEKEHAAHYAVCVFDAPGPTFRDDLYSEYKAQRKPMPDDLRSQWAPIHEVVQSLGWTVLNVPGVEADDVIGTVARVAAEQGVRVIISSGDKDLSQLVNERITIIDTMSGKVRDVAGVIAEFGVPPALMIDLQTLMGDSIDNVPGVQRVGEKTAAKWLHQYGSLDNLLCHAAEVKGVVGQNLRAAVSWLPIGRQLLTIKTDCDLTAHIPAWPALASLLHRPQDLAQLHAFYAQYGFKGLVRGLEADMRQGGQLAAAVPVSEARVVSPISGDSGDLFASTEPAFVPEPPSTRYETITDWQRFEVWLQRLQAAELVALDTETTSLDQMRAEIVGISWSVAVGEAAYLPLAHNGPDMPVQLPRDEVLAKLSHWLENPLAKKLGQHIKYDRHVFANHGIQVRGYVHDTMLQSYVLEVQQAHNLASLALRHLGRTGISYEELCGKGVHQIPFAQVELSKAAPYACEDSDMTLAVHQCLWPQLQNHVQLQRIYQLEIDTSEALFQVERHGVLVDAQVLAQQSHALGQRIVQLQEQAYQEAGQVFNLASPKQLGEIFFDKLGLPVVKKTATGSRSTDEEVLEKLAENYALPATILQHRSLAKLKNTYTDKLATLTHPGTGRVHTHYAQAVAVTGRLSSNEPNLQNIPIRTAEGRRVREAFVAPPGYLLASADYSQIELRIMAHLSADTALLQAFAAGLDVHRATASEIFAVPATEVTTEQRRHAKVINFGLIYGMSAFGLAKALAIDNSAAKRYIERYFARFQGVKQYMEQTKAQARNQGYVETVFGRRLYLPDIHSPSSPRRSAAERAAINAPMQGTAADLIKMSMVAVQAEIAKQGLATRVIMQVHDELVFELPLAEQDWVRHEVPRLMAGVASLAVPLLAEVGLGCNWEQAH